MPRTDCSKVLLGRPFGFAVFLVAVPAWILIGCASSSAPNAPIISSQEQAEARQSMTSEILVRRVEHRQRMLEIEYRLARLLAPQCGSTMSRPHAGVLVTTLESFSQNEFSISGADSLTDSKQMTIVYAVPGGSFDRGGLRKGDQILALDDEPVTSAADLTTLMLSSADRRSVRVKVRRTGAPPFEAWVPLDSTCPIRLRLTADTLIFMWQTERLLLSVPLGLVRNISDDSMLAVVIAHQFAHTLFDKPSDDALTAEMRADRIGLRLASAAGYAIGSAIGYWEAVAMEYPVLIGDAPPKWRPLAWEQNKHRIQVWMSHPEIGRRMKSIRSIVHEESATDSGPSDTQGAVRLNRSAHPQRALDMPSIGEERKTHVPDRHRVFAPGVCCRSSWAVSS